MAKYTGYVLIPHATYDEWRNATNGNGYDVDLHYGCQCWDLVSEFWWNVGFPQYYPTLAGTGSAYGMWADRQVNAGIEFDLIYDVEDIKRGDVIVFNYFPGNQYGHTGFADVDYDAWVRDPSQPYEFPILSENNQGTPDPQGGAYTNIHGYDIRLFLGAFRYKQWKTTPPVFKPLQVTTKFPWAIYARKLRSKR